MTNTNTPDTTVEEDAIFLLESLALERVKLKDEAQHIKDRVEEIDAMILGRLPAGTHQAGPFKIVVKNGARRLNTKRLVEAYPVTAHPELYSAAPDTSKVKAHIAPVDLDAFYDAGAPSVVVS